MDGRQPDKLLLGKGFPGGTCWLREGQHLLRLLTILETMTNNNKVGSKGDLLSTTELTGFLPDLTGPKKALQNSSI